MKAEDSRTLRLLLLFLSLFLSLSHTHTHHHYNSATFTKLNSWSTHTPEGKNTQDEEEVAEKEVNEEE